MTSGSEDASRCLLSASEILFFCVTPALFFCVVGAHVCVNSMSPGFLEPTTPRVYKTRQIQEIEQVGRGGVVGQVGGVTAAGESVLFSSHVHHHILG